MKLHTEDSKDPRGFFRDHVVNAIKRMGLSVREWTEYYLVDLLARQVYTKTSVDFGATLVQLLVEAKKTSTARESLLRYKALGDSALFLSGFYVEHIGRRGVDPGYVRSMGSSAYQKAAESASDGLVSVYKELAEGFKAFAAVLDEVREQTSQRSPQDVVRLYERWRSTGSDSSARRLQEEGLFPAKGEDDEVN